MPPARRSSALIVVNYGSAHLLEQNLAPLSRAAATSGAASRTASPLFVVVDNFSTAEERDRITRLASTEGWELVASESNLGFGGGVDLGAARAIELGAQRLILVNPDAALTLDGLTALDAAAAAQPRTLFAPLVVRPDGTTWSKGSTVDLRDGRIRGRRGEVAPSTELWLSGACLAMSIELYREVGGMAHEYFLYWEDVEFSHRVTAAGGDLQVLETARVVHDDGGTQRTQPRRDRGKSAVYYYFNIRNHLLFAARNLDDEQLGAWLRASPAVSREIMLRGGRRQFLHRPFSLMSAYLRGRRDGARIARDRLAASRPETPTAVS